MDESMRPLSRQHKFLRLFQSHPAGEDASKMASKIILRYKNHTNATFCRVNQLLIVMKTKVVAISKSVKCLH